MKARVIICIYLILSIFFIKCEFHPDDLQLSPIEPPGDQGPPVLLRLNDINDTIKIGWKANLVYSISGSDNKLISVSITFNGKEIHHYAANNDQSLSFLFDPATYPNGKYQMNIKIITTTGSGSIADKMLAEGYLYELNWPVVIDKNMPSGFSYYKVNAVRSSKGIELSWPSFNHANFISYKIYRQYPVFQKEAELVTTISDPNLTTFTDTTFWEGQNAHYNLAIETPAGPFHGEYIWFFDKLTGLAGTWQIDGSLYIKWDKAKNLESFNKYNVLVSYNNTVVEEQFIDDVNQNYATFKNIGFGGGSDITLRFIPKFIIENEYKYLENEQIRFWPPPLIPTCRIPYHINNHTFLLLSDFRKITKYYPDNHTTERSLNVNISAYWVISVSSDGENFAYYQDGKFYVRSTDNFDIINEFAGPTLIGTNNIADYSLSDDGKILAIDSNCITYLFDCKSGLLLRKDSLNIYWYPLRTAKLSPDGTRMVTHIGDSAKLLELDTSGWKTKGSAEIEQNSLYTVFYSKDGTKVYIVTYNEIQARRTDNFGLIYDYLLPQGIFSGVDLDRERFVWSSNQTGINNLYDLNTGAVLYSFPGGIGFCTPFDNYLIVSGFQLTLP